MSSRKRVLSTKEDPSRKKPDRKPSPRGITSGTVAGISDAASEPDSEPSGDEEEAKKLTRSRSLRSVGSAKPRYKESSDEENPQETEYTSDEWEDDSRKGKATASRRSLATQSNKDDSDDELDEACNALGITEQKMTELWESFGIPAGYSRKVKVPSKSKATKGEANYYVASNVTTAALKHFASWDFEDFSKATAEHNILPLKAVAMRDIYRTQDKSGTVGLLRPPELRKKLGEGRKLSHFRILASILKYKKRITDTDFSLEIPLSWAEDGNAGRPPIVPDTYNRPEPRTPVREKRNLPDPPSATAFSEASILSPQRTPTRALASVVDTFVAQPQISNTSDQVSLERTERSTTLAFSPETDNVAAAFSRGKHDYRTEFPPVKANPLGENRHEPSKSETAQQSNAPDNLSPTSNSAMQNIDIAGLQLEDACRFIDACRWKELQSRSGENIGMALIKFLGLPTENPKEEDIERLEHAIEPYYAIWRIKDAKGRVLQRLENQTTKSRREIGDEGKYGPQIDMNLNDYLISDRLEASYSPAIIVLSWLESEKLASTNAGMNRPNEIQVETKRGNLIPSLFYGPDLLQLRCNDMRFPTSMRLLGMTPRPDFAVRLGGKAFASWPQNVRPVIISADAKLEDEERTQAQLSVNSYGTLLLLVLMYLDQRPTEHDRLPGYFWIPSICYHANGIKIYAHYPKIMFTQNGDREWEWAFCTTIVTSNFNECFKTDSHSRRTTALAAILLLRDHCFFLRKALEQWVENPSPDARAVIDRLIARGHWESGNIDWIKKEANKVGNTE